MNGLHRTQCWHIVGLQHHMVRGPQLAETCRMPTADAVRAVPTTPASWEVRDAGWSSPPCSCGRLSCRRGGRGRDRRAALHCSHLRHGLGRGRARFQAPGVRSTPGGGRRRGGRRGRRGSGPSGRAGERASKELSRARGSAPVRREHVQFAQHPYYGFLTPDLILQPGFRAFPCSSLRVQLWRPDSDSGVPGTHGSLRPTSQGSAEPWG
ncbi:transmembrane protein 229B isoform X2 [Zalophus californianus]|uniref:Transmembrane protein 229B isoform X2 n=1 Tax=Zalophus californianus TaxID=9704 RepID=A0A6J2B7D0_ZALCA|nr:transmembrane protein 229B isoform X2 [Zalophus californianus]